MPIIGEKPRPSRLRPCPDCSKEISVHARTCPHCGRSFTTVGGVFIALVLTFILAALLGFFH